MSGSSLDGLDLAVCRFRFDPARPRPVLDWEIVAGKTFPYPPHLSTRLSLLHERTETSNYALEVDLARFLAERIAHWLPRPVSAIGYHGHTHLHEPAAGYSIQLGNGATIAVLTGLPTVTRLRDADIAAGGQGAPLAPVADKHLFPEHRAFLNLGGIANLCVRRDGGRFVAGDTSGCCQVLDRLARLLGREYDADGAIARSGTYLPELATALDGLSYHHEAYPKSLANNWVRDQLYATTVRDEWTVADRLRTFTVWLAEKINQDMGAVAGASLPDEVLVTGGGARNGFLLECLNAGPDGPKYIVPDPKIVDFKEAALIALCALLRLHGLPNSLASATGASRDTVNGALYV